MVTRRQFIVGAGALAIAPALPALPTPSRVTFQGVPIIFDDELIDLRGARMTIMDAEFLRRFEQVVKENCEALACQFIEHEPPR